MNVGDTHDSLLEELHAAHGRENRYGVPRNLASIIPYLHLRASDFNHISMRRYYVIGLTLNFFRDFGDYKSIVFRTI